MHDLWEGSELYWMAWFTLHYRRPMLAGMQGVFPQPLAYDQMVCYARNNGWTSYADVEEFVEIMTAMDAVFFQHSSPKKGKKAT